MMKPKEYVRKYNLEKSLQFNHNEFVGDLTIDFQSLIEVHFQSGSWNLSKFNVCVKDIRQKWDSISSRSLEHLPEKLWKYFYATIVVPAKEKYCGEEIRRKREEYEQNTFNWYKPYYTTFKNTSGEKSYNFDEEQFKQIWQKTVDDFFQEAFKRLFMMPTSVSIPASELEFLGLSSDCSAEDVSKSYRELSKKYHPDCGGSHKEFLRLTECKNRVVAYVNSRGI